MQKAGSVDNPQIDIEDELKTSKISLLFHSSWIFIDVSVFSFVCPSFILRAGMHNVKTCILNLNCKPCHNLNYKPSSDRPYSIV